MSEYGDDNIELSLKCDTRSFETIIKRVVGGLEGDRVVELEEAQENLFEDIRQLRADLAGAKVLTKFYADQLKKHEKKASGDLP